MPANLAIYIPVNSRTRDAKVTNHDTALSPAQADDVSDPSHLFSSTSTSQPSDCYSEVYESYCCTYSEQPLSNDTTVCG
jgi:hypothetical protein